MNDNLSISENRRDTIERYRVYSRFLESLAQAFPQGVFTDIGCGRGELLELSRSFGFMPRGAEIDAGMVAICRGLGLEVDEGAPLSWLSAQGDNSVAAIVALRLAERLPPEELRRLMDEALRVLAPGGLLVLETPNIENIVIATSAFYQDEKRLRPLPLKLLERLPLQVGFARSCGIRVHERSEIRHMASARLIDVLREVSPVVAVIAQKPADAYVMEMFDAAFAGQYGESLDDLARRFEHGVEQRIAQAIDERNNEYRNRMAATESYEVVVRDLIRRHEEKLDAMYHSTSWRLTAPVRMVMNRILLVKRLLRRITGKVKHLIAIIVIAMMHRVVGDPHLLRLARKAQASAPGLANRLKRLAFGDAAVATAVSCGDSISEDQISTGTRAFFEKLQARAGN
ncbi:MAG: class I SAM-dependent methyltransferase [Agrobacterium sp.]|nr:class I SAM-dependent methyltransferase [Agrobacterium sp.]